MGYRDRPQGSESKLNTVSDGCRVLKTIVRLFKDYKPLLFFGLLSLIVFAVALILFIPVFIEYGRTGLVRRLPTLVTAGFMGMAALLLLVCGLTQGKTSRQQYELQMNAMQMLYDLGRQERQGEAEGKKAS